MHPLKNGSQAEIRPPKKPTQGNAGWFTESGENNAPSYPGQDWFNTNIAEFLNALDALGIAFNPDDENHLAQAFEFLNRKADLKGGKNYTYTFSGKAFDSEDGVGDPFASWTHATVDYDSDTNEFLVFYNTNSGHNINTNSVLLRKKYASSDAFSSPIIIASDKGNYSYKCQAAGIAANGDYVALIARFPWSSGRSDATYVYRSSNKGATWTSSLMQSGGNTVVAFNGDVSGFLVTETGRILTFAVEYDTYLTRIFYSDDDGVSWSQSSISGAPTDATEPAWCDIGDGKIVCIARASVRSGTTDEIIPAKFMTSSDNGSTFTAPVDSQSITNYTLSNGQMIPDYETKTIEFIHHSRFTEDDDFSSILVSRASFDDAFSDNFSQQIRVGKLAAYTPLDGSTGDSGYIGAKAANNGVINGFFYTGRRVDAQISWFVANPNTNYVAVDKLIDLKTGERVSGGGVDATAIYSPLYENGYFNPKHPYALRRGFIQGSRVLSMASIILDLPGSGGLIRESMQTSRTIDFSKVDSVFLDIDSFSGDGDIGIALYDIENVNLSDPTQGRMLFEATKQPGRFVVDVSQVNGVYYMHVILTGSTVSSAVVSAFGLSFKGSNHQVYPQTFNRVAFRYAYGLAGRAGLSVGGEFGSGSGTTTVDSVIEHGCTSSSSGTRTRTQVFDDVIPDNVSLVSAKMSLLLDGVDGFNAGLALYTTKNPTSPTDGRVGTVFTNDDGTLVLDVPSQRPLYLHLVVNATGVGVSNVAFFNDIYYA